MTIGKLAILGGGAVARALGPRLAAAGLEVVAWSRAPEAAAAVGRPVTLQELGGADAAWILVRDRAISEVCGRLLAAGGPPVVLHGSGYFGTEVLEGATARGVLHPLVSFPDGAVPDLAGAGASVSGDDQGASVARGLAAALGLEVFDLPDDPLARARYHAAASLCANGTAALFDIALEALPPGQERSALQQACASSTLRALGKVAGGGPSELTQEGRAAAGRSLVTGPAGLLSELAVATHSLLVGRTSRPTATGLEQLVGVQDDRSGAVMSFCVSGVVALVDLALEVLPSGVDQAAAGGAFAHLTSGVLRRVATHGPCGALTGPVPRGDAEVVSGHLEVLPPEAGEVYRVLAGRMLDLADLDSDKDGVIRSLLAE